MNFYSINSNQKKSWTNLEKKIPNNLKEKNIRRKMTQMQKVLEQGTIRVVIVDSLAYWVHNNSIYKAIVDEEGIINSEGAEVVDVFSLSNKEAKKLLDIIDSIKE
jgi:hypothetical protein